MSLLIVAGWLLGWILLWRLPTLDPPSSRRPPGRVVVVVPARNEADRLPGLLASLARQTMPPERVVVVDDGSTDGTGSVAAGFPGVEVVDAPPVPPGWTGKAAACAVGAGHAGGDVLVFLDADVTLDGGALAAVLSTWEENGGLVSVQPHHVIERPVEALSLPFNVVGLMGLGIGSLLPPRHEWGAAGPLVVTSRADYERVGGHAAVGAAIAEDLALADRYRAAGLPVRCLAGGGLVGFRMYRGLRELVIGWSKNFATGARRTPPLRAVAIALWMTALVAASAGVVGVVTGATDPTTAGLLHVGGAVQLGVLGRRVGRFGPAALVWPALVAGFVVVFVCSTLATIVARRVRWSGRTVRLGGDGPGTGRTGHVLVRARRPSSRPRL